MIKSGHLQQTAHRIFGGKASKARARHSGLSSSWRPSKFKFQPQLQHANDEPETGRKVEFESESFTLFDLEHTHTLSPPLNTACKLKQRLQRLQ